MKRLEHEIQNRLNAEFNFIFDVYEQPGIYYRVLSIRLLDTTFSPYEVIDVGIYGIEDQLWLESEPA